MSCNFCCTSPSKRSAPGLAGILLKIAACCAVLWFLTPLAMAAAVVAQDWHTEIPQAKAVGHGELHWFGLRIYSATLWSEHYPFDARAAFALELTYQRHISGERFVQTSLDEIKRLSEQQFSADKLKLWETQMTRAFHDVNDGDQLIGIFIPGHGCRFYDSTRLLADIDDPEFAHAFFDIWFNPRTKDSSLRAHLLGLNR